MSSNKMTFLERSHKNVRILNSFLKIKKILIVESLGEEEVCGHILVLITMRSMPEPQDIPENPTLSAVNPHKNSQ